MSRLVGLEMNSVKPTLLDRHRGNFWLSADCTLLESLAVVTRAVQWLVRTKSVASRSVHMQVALLLINMLELE